MADFEDELPALEGLDAQVIAASADGPEEARGTVEKLDLEFTVLYGLDPEKTSRGIGCYAGKHKGGAHIQPASFVLRRDGTIALAVYSSGKVGRLTAEDAMTKLGDLNREA